MQPTADPPAKAARIATHKIDASPFSTTIYGDPAGETVGLIDGIRDHGILVPLVVHPLADDRWGLVSGHRRLACAVALGIAEVPCVVRTFAAEADLRRAILEYNRQRPKNFEQMMREADALADLIAAAARDRRLANLRPHADGDDRADRRDSDDRAGRTDATIARAIGLGGKDAYRQARAVWKLAQSGDVRARSGVAQLNAGTKTIHAAYKDLRRRDRFTAGFRPTPYDVWSFKHDRAFGIPHPGSIPPGIVAHALHYFTQPGDLVIDPMAGGGTTLDVCTAMGRRCLAYDIEPTRPDVVRHDITLAWPPEVRECDLIFCDPPYHTMLARAYAPEGIATAPLSRWLDFLQRLARDAFGAIRPGGHLAILVANQTEKDLPAGHGYLDHAFFAYNALIAAGFLPERRISCPMDGAYLPQHVRRARVEGRMLGQVRDLVVGRRPRTDPDQGRGSPAANS